jgi:cathepsin L
MKFLLPALTAGLLALAGLTAQASPTPHEEETARPGMRNRSTDRAFDWTALGIARVVRDQKGRNGKKTGTCWAQVGVAALEANWEIRNGTHPVLAVQPVLDATRRRGGGTPELVFEALTEHGTALEKHYPWFGLPGRLNGRTPYRAEAWGYVVRGGKQPSLARLKQALIKHGPLYVGVYARTRSFKRYRSGVIRDRITSGKTDHAVLLVGWDDAKKAWKIKNSWGTRWGGQEKGFGWVGYGSNNLGRRAAWVRAPRSSRH